MRPGTKPFVLLGGFGILAMVSIALLRALSQSPDPSSGQASDAPASRPVETIVRTGDEPEIPKPVPIAEAIQPWEATRENSPPTPPGQIPAWKMNSPRPDPETGPLPTPKSPPSAATRPPMDNPGGADRDRVPQPQ